MHKIDYKPLSVNEAYTGQRFKTDTYRSFAKAVTLMIRPVKLPESPYKITLVFGVSNIGADFDNPIKPYIDVLAKKMRFNDKLIFKGDIEKVQTKKGEEFIMWKLEHHVSEIII